tara:strand:- start:548 stop:1114 length:567 start_codon:yes stop_codon:yes gene_type:complete
MMGSTVAESFIRKQVRRILAEEAAAPKEGKPKADKPESQSEGAGQVWSGIRGGRLPKWAVEALGGSKKAERLAYTNPAALMKNLKLSPASGETTVKRVEQLVIQSFSSRPEMGEAFGDPEARKDSAGKNGVFVPAGELAGRTGSTIMHDLIYGAWKAGYLRLTGNIRLEQMDGGTIIFNVSKKSDRWE